MISSHKILYATIKSWELAQRIEREDYAFDAFEFLAEKIGHKNPSTLRKMCEPRQIANAAKLGYEEAIIIMATTRDYRLLKFIIEELRASASRSDNQLGIFSSPIRSIDETKL